MTDCVEVGLAPVQVALESRLQPSCVARGIPYLIGGRPDQHDDGQDVSGHYHNYHHDRDDDTADAAFKQSHGS